MQRRRKLPHFFAVSMIAMLVMLAGCGTAGETASPTAPSAATLEPGGVASFAEGEAGTGSAASCTLLNLNEATEGELMATIPGFSSRMAREFFEYRPYSSIQQFRREIGKYVDEATITRYEKYVYVPVDPEEADAATLMQLPGVDEAVAAALIAGRPYASNEAFLQALAARIDARQLAAAGCYLAMGS